MSLFLYKARQLFAFEKVEKAMSNSSVYCNLCCRVIEKRNERVLLSKGWKQVDVATEIESLKISLRSTENHLLETLTIENTSPRFSREQALWGAINKRIIAVHHLLDYFDVLFVSNRHRWHSHVVYMPNLVFHHRSQRRYDNENTRTTRLFEQSIRSDRKALENQRFAVACSANLQKYFDLQEIHEARFPVQVEDYRFQTALSRL